MSRHWKVRLYDMMRSIRLINQYVENMDIDAFVEDEKTYDACIRKLQIIGEAAKHVPTEICEKYDQIAWSEIIGMRNKITHEYFGVNDELVWAVLQEDIQDLYLVLQIIKKDYNIVFPEEQKT